MRAVTDVSTWMCLGPAQPFRVNLRYTPDRADLRLVGDFTEASVPLMTRLLDILRHLPAPLVLDTSGMTSAVHTIEVLLAHTLPAQPEAA